MAILYKAFQWFRYYTFFEISVYGKANRSSVIIHDTYLAFVDLYSTLSTPPSDISPRLVSFFDITEPTAGFTYYNASKRGYTTPLSVSVLVNGNTPTVGGGFVEGLQDVFSTSVYMDMNPSNSSNSTMPSNTKTRATMTKIVVSSTISGLVVLGFIVVAAFYLVRRRKMRKPTRLIIPELSGDDRSIRKLATDGEKLLAKLDYRRWKWNNRHSWQN